MVAALISLVGGLFQVAGKLFDWLYARQMVDAGRTSDQLQALKEQVDAG